MNALSVIMQIIPVLLPIINDVEKAVDAIEHDADGKTKISIIDKAVDDVALALKSILHSVFNK